MATTITAPELTQDQADAWVGATVRTLMQASQITTHELAQEIGMTDQTLRNRLRGDRSWSALELIRMASALEVEPGELLNGWGGRVKIPDAPSPDFTRARLGGGRRKPGHVRTLWAGNVGADAPIAQLAELRTFNPKDATFGHAAHVYALNCMVPQLWTARPTPVRVLRNFS